MRSYGLRRWQFSHHTRHIRLRPDASHQLLYLTLALVPRGVEKLAVIGDRQVRREQADGCEMECAVGQLIEDDRKAPRRSRGFDAQIRGVLREVEHLHAVGEKRRAALLRVQLARIHLHEQRDELSRGEALPRTYLFELCQ